MIHCINISTSKRCDFIDITSKIKKVIHESGVSSGTCHVFVPHTTAALTINENADPAVRRDIINMLKEIVPQEARYAHAEGNSDAHIKSSLLGQDTTVLIENGGLKLGTWQGIFFCEFDGPRRRDIWVKIGGLENADKDVRK